MEQVRAELAARYCEVRAASMRLCEPLAIEDYVVQTMPDVSPPKWHLAHTTWFFETFVLEPFCPGFEPLEPEYRVLFNSYYQTVGAQHARPERGFLSRPTVAEIESYRQRVDARVLEFVASVSDENRAEVARRITVGLHHEQQHQELLLMDLKYNFSRNPLKPAYIPEERPESADQERVAPLSWVARDGGMCEFGHAEAGFCFDNETPHHRTYVPPFRLASRAVTNGEYAEFIADGGYAQPALWLSDGWATVQQHGWRAPLYWEQRDGAWFEFTMRGIRPLRVSEPVCHVSFYEADAFARWAGKRLPTEFEWELVARDAPIAGTFVESGRFHPAPAASTTDGAADQDRPVQLFGDVWEWTQSPYSAYPGYCPLPGALGEYNGKFMCSQYVLRGGSCLTPESHIRATYRNFFYPHQQWNTQGFRLAEHV